MEPALSVQNLAKRYPLGRRDGSLDAVRGISFSVQKGEIFGLLGPNGAGKTTTLDCIVGLQRPDAGSVQIAGIDALAHPERARELTGVQLQTTALQDKITSRQALKFFSAFYKKSANVEALLAQFDLEKSANYAFDSLNRGHRQRLAIALALVHQPEIIFLDEPTAGLDPIARLNLHTTITGLKAAGKTILLTTHYIDEAQKLCDRVALIDEGIIIATGSPSELIAASNLPPRILVQTARPLTAEQASTLRAVTSTRLTEYDRWQLGTTSVTQTLIALVNLIESQKNELLDIQIHAPTLEDVFIEKTGNNRFPAKLGSLHARPFRPL